MYVVRTFVHINLLKILFYQVNVVYLVWPDKWCMSLEQTKTGKFELDQHSKTTNSIPASSISDDNIRHASIVGTCELSIRTQIFIPVVLAIAVLDISASFLTSLRTKAHSDYSRGKIVYLVMLFQVLWRPLVPQTTAQAAVHRWIFHPRLTRHKNHLI